MVDDIINNPSARIAQRDQTRGVRTSGGYYARPIEPYAPHEWLAAWLKHLAVSINFPAFSLELEWPAEETGSRTVTFSDGKEHSGLTRG